jgi:hypothetical protein
LKEAGPASSQKGSITIRMGRVFRRARTHSQSRFPRIKVPSRSTHKTGKTAFAGLAPVADPIRRSSHRHEGEMRE